jgi:integrase
LPGRPRLKRKTAVNHKRRIERILEFCDDQNCGEVSTPALRSFLRTIDNDCYANNFVKSLRVYFRDYMKRGDLVESFKIVQTDGAPPKMAAKAELRTFHGALDTALERALFLIYASTGRRRLEILNLKLDDLDLPMCMIHPNSNSATKHTLYSFYNAEAAAALNEYLKTRVDKYGTGRVFIIQSAKRDRIFAAAKSKTGLDITPRVLRFWFANEMSRLGVQDRFINALQGRTPRSVLARHYADYSMENLKAVYDKAKLSVLK